MILKDFIIKSLGDLLKEPLKIRGEVEFDLNVIPVKYALDGKEFFEIIVIGEGNPNHSRIKFKANL